MIKSRDEYDFVTIPDEIRIDGGIMPARDVAGDGSWRQLRGEDPAFLMEGVRERKKAVWASTETRVELDRAIRASRLAGVAFDIRKMASHRAAPYFVKPFEDVAVHGAVDGSFDTFFQDAKFTADDLASSEDDFAVGAPLRADPVRALFYDMQRLRSFVAGTTAETNGTSWEIEKSAYNEDHTFYPPSSPSSVVYLYEMGMERQIDGQPEGGSYSMECRLSKGSFSSSLEDTSAADLVSLCKTYAVFAAGYNLYKHATSEGSVSEGSYSCVPVPCTIADGVARVEAADIMAAADDIIGHHGWQKVGWNQTEYSVQEIRISISDIYAVWTLGNHTDISPLGWNWNPYRH